MKSLLIMIPLGIIFIVTFLAYSGFRTWAVTVSFQPKVFATDLLVASIFDVPIFFIALAACAKGYFGAPAKPGILLATTLITIFIASAICELNILHDEGSFMQQALASKRDTFSRPRAWPSRDSTLMYSKEDGVWATE